MQVLMTPRTAMGKKDTKRAQFVSAPELHGTGAVAIASNGKTHASIGVNGKLALWDAENSKLLCQVTLQLPPEMEKHKNKAAELQAKPPKWVSFDCAGTCLGIHRPGVGLWLCKVKATAAKTEVTDALMLGDCKMSERFTWVGFSCKEPGLLAVGVDSGRVMLYSPYTNKLTAQKEGKHPGKHIAIVAGDWLADGRLAVASGERMKVSAPIVLTDSGGNATDPVWKTFSKFYIQGMTAKIPTSVRLRAFRVRVPPPVSHSLHALVALPLRAGDERKGQEAPSWRICPPLLLHAAHAQFSHMHLTPRRCHHVCHVSATAGV
jgi:hypothetical protein